MPPSSGPVVYVLDSAPSGGDGSRDRPFRSMLDSGFDVPTGGILVIGKGTYQVPDIRFRDVTVVGTCAAETTLRQAPGVGFPAVVALRGTTAIRDVQVDGGGIRTGVAITGHDADVSLYGVEVIAGAGPAYIAGGPFVDPPTGSVVAERLVVRDTVPDAGGYGVGVLVENLNATFRGLIIARAFGAGLFARGRSRNRVVLEDASIREIELDRPDLVIGGSGVVFLDHGDLEIRRTIIERVSESALFYSPFADASAILEDVVARDSSFAAGYEPPDAYRVGPGLTLHGVASLRRVHLDNIGESPGEAALVLDVPGAIVDAQDVVISDYAQAIEVDWFGQLSLRRAVIVGGTGGVVLAENMGTTVLLEDLYVGGSRFMPPDPIPDPSGSGTEMYHVTGAALVTWIGASLDVRRAIFDDVPELGLLSIQSGPTSMEDVSMRLTRSNGAGDGIFASSSDPVSVRRTLIEGVSRTGASFHGTDAVVEDVAIRQVGAGYLEQYGAGLVVRKGGRLRARRVAVSEVQLVGLSASDVETELDAQDITVRGVATNDCAFSGCITGGHGIGIYRGAAARITRFEVDDVHLCGIHLDEAADARITEGQVARAEIGLCVQQEGFDLGEIQSSVGFVENGSNLQSPSLPVPSVPELDPGDLPPNQ